MDKEGEWAANYKRPGPFISWTSTVIEKTVSKQVDRCILSRHDGAPCIVVALPPVFCHARTPGPGCGSPVSPHQFHRASSLDRSFPKKHGSDARVVDRWGARP